VTVSLPNQFKAKKSQPIDFRNTLIGPRFGSYRNCQTIATETEEMMVGKKYRVLKKVEVREFFSKKIANRSEKAVWNMTTKKVNSMLLLSTLLKIKSSVSIREKLFRPTNSGSPKPSHFVSEYLRLFIVGYK
jgi:hypothetical protein